MGLGRVLFSFYMLVILVFYATSASSQARIYRLEEAKIVGTDRITIAQIQKELSLQKGALLNDDAVMNVRERLLGLGLFKSVMLYMRKGSSKGQAKLIIEVQDDDTVLGPWAIGGEIAITSGQPKAASIDPNAPSYGYLTSIVARNILKQGHRASLLADIDSKSVLREGRIAYGMPRFSEESVQFDASLHFVDVSHRYLNTLGFGQKGEAHWTLDGEEGSVQYGVAMYRNQKERFDLPKFPNTIAGPKISYHKETRLLGFIPKKGHGYKVSLLFPPAAKSHYILEFGGASTFNFYDKVWGTFEGKLMGVGAIGISSRLEAHFDIPIGRSYKTSEFAKLFVKLRAGSDRILDTRLEGSSAAFGLRYHSPGFIAELAFKLTKVPNEVKPFLKPTPFRKGGVQ